MSEATDTNTAITFDPDTDTYRLSHDRQSDESLTTTISRAIAIVLNTPPTELDPLYETVDADALNQLFTEPTDTALHDAGRVSFRVNDCAVKVHATGLIEITPAEETCSITAPVPHPFRDR